MKIPPARIVGRVVGVVSTVLALGCQRHAEPVTPRPVAVADAGAPSVATPVTVADASTAAPLPTGVLEGVVRLNGPLPRPQPIALDGPTAQRPGCAEAARGYYATTFGLSAPGPLPFALVKVDAHAPAPLPMRRRFVTFNDCSITPRLMVMSLDDMLVLQANTTQYHLPKVDGMGASIAMLLRREEDQEKRLEHPGRYIIHSVNFPTWMQTPLLVTPAGYYDQADREGHYRIEHLPEGTFTVHAWFPDARDVSATVTVHEGQVTQQDFVLQPIAPSEIHRPAPPADAGPIIP